MRLEAIKLEMAKSRWSMDMIVCSIVASASYLYGIRLTSMFETSAPDPGFLITNLVIIFFGYILSMFAGRMFLRQRISSFVWISIVGSIIVAITRLVLTLPTSIEKIPSFFVIFLSLTGVAMIGAFCARALRLLGSLRQKCDEK
jgi:hypothetical protein